jgi:hypothetical protein
MMIVVVMSVALLGLAWAGLVMGQIIRYSRQQSIPAAVTQTYLDDAVGEFISLFNLASLGNDSFVFSRVDGWLSVACGVLSSVVYGLLVVALYASDSLLDRLCAVMLVTAALAAYHLARLYVRHYIRFATLCTLVTNRLQSPSS